MTWLRDLSWRFFTLTGDIDAYLLYKEQEEVAATNWHEANVGEYQQDKPME